ncbi:hypothetical protein KUTeg_002892 [Tegillarca granosa]|uniref:Uncharacterized protein n=1 Tax=Tegillarca granosa TaxID=220873 RepID=A0ABQ9FQG1_TEGGR|nr:hypothetical protein KUTeg_002892 [Tegillarca granosa]
MDQTEVNNIKFDAVHRFGRLDKKPRKIVAKFSSRKDKERVKSEARKNRNSNFKVFDQYPEEVIRERQRLVPIMKAERDKGNDPYITYNKLIVNGRPYIQKREVEEEQIHMGTQDKDKDKVKEKDRTIEIRTGSRVNLNF